MENDTTSGTSPVKRILPRRQVARLQSMGAVLAGARGNAKRPATQRSRVRGGWIGHAIGGHLDEGLEDYLAGRLPGCILFPGTVVRPDGSTLLVLDADTKAGYRWLHREKRCAYRLSNPDKPLRAHAGFWLPAGVRAGNGHWHGGDIRHLPHRGGGIGTPLRLYPGELDAIVKVLDGVQAMDGEQARAFLAGITRELPQVVVPLKCKAFRPPAPGHRGFPWLEWYLYPMERVHIGCRDNAVFAKTVLMAATGVEPIDAARRLNAQLPCTPLDPDQLISIAHAAPPHASWLTQRPRLLRWILSRSPTPERHIYIAAVPPQVRRSRGGVTRGRQQEAAARARDDGRVAELDGLGYSGRAIARQLGITHPRVQRALARIRAESNQPKEALHACASARSA